MDTREKNLCKSQFYKNNKLKLALTLFLQCIVTLANISLAFFIMLIVGAMEQTDINLFVKSLIFIGIVLVVFLAVSAVLKMVKNSYMKQALSQFKGYVFNKILKKSIGEFNAEFSNKFISAFSNDLNQIEVNYLGGTITIFGLMFMFIAAIIAMAFINTTITICVCVGCLIPIVISSFFSKKVMISEQSTSDENASFVGQMKDLLNGFLTIKSFKAEDEVLDLFAKQNLQLEETKQDRRENNDNMSIAGQMCSVIVVLVIFIVGIYFIFKGKMTIASILGCVQLSNYITDPIKQLVPLMSNRHAADGLISKLAITISDNNNVVEGVNNITSFEDSIDVKNAVIKYDDKVVLDNVSVNFDRGKSYAIVGGSGSGKSTLLKLILGYFSNYSGSVSIDGLELKDIKLESLYDVVSIIEQNVFLFDKSIKDNITLFKKFPEDKMQNAIEMSGLAKLISEKGLEYNCGENGCNLSGGEKQRVSIARCLIRQTPVLLMDEATAALDNETSFQVENEILNIQGLTKIIVTHKLHKSLLEKYDEIICMKDGKIIEQGSFDELMNREEYFYSLFNITQV